MAEFGDLSDLTSGRVLVVHPDIKGVSARARPPGACLDEAVGLAAAIALEVVHGEVAPLKKPRPATLLGMGVIDRLKGLIAEFSIDVVVVNTALTPVQQRNLEKAFDCKVIDRTGLILEIFGERARTREGTLQVELAALTFQKSRLVRSWTHLERQRGGAGFLGGPGERQIESDRRAIAERITRIKRELEDVKRTRKLHRSARKKVPYPVVALVGYTNAGKSTLFNRLTGSDVFAKDLLFATLDPTMREVTLPSGRKIILSDTVGFISDLPTDLIAAFRATLEEVLEADLIIHVRDISHGETASQRRDVHDVLASLGLDEAQSESMIEVLNKVDLLETGQVENLPENAAFLNGGKDTEDKDSRNKDSGNKDTGGTSIYLSALTGQGCDAFLALVDERLAGGLVVGDYPVCLADGAAIAWLYRHGEVLERHDDETLAHMSVRMSPVDVEKFRKYKKVS